MRAVLRNFKVVVVMEADCEINATTEVGRGKRREKIASVTRHAAMRCCFFIIAAEGAWVVEQTCIQRRTD